MAITVYGASNDLIEIDGDISEEFVYTGIRKRPEDDDDDLLAFSDGTILRIRFDNDLGGWRITPVVRGASNPVIEQAAEDAEGASDKARLDAAWVVHGIGWAKR
jgi:hypothetical protein